MVSVYKYYDNKVLEKRTICMSLCSGNVYKIKLLANLFKQTHYLWVFKLSRCLVKSHKLINTM